MPFRGGLPSDSRADDPITVDAVAEQIRITCAVPSAGPTVGAEVEWLVVDSESPGSRPRAHLIDRTLTGLAFPGGSRVSFEPGGQVELSSPPGRSADDVFASLRADIAVLRPALRARDLDLSAAAHDPSRSPVRVSDSARYEVMERWFTAGGWPAAREMMCNTTSVQVNVGCGPDPAVTWQRANALAPVLAAAFAASSRDGWASSRLRTWAEIDPTRTASAYATGDPLNDWTEYALSALTIMRYRDDGRVEPLPGAYTFREWIEGAAGAAQLPRLADIDLHLSTLFPPVRLKGWTEIRVIDMPPADWWPVPVAVTAALLTPGGPDSDLEWLNGVSDIGWVEAARLGLSSPALAASADSAFRLAVERLDSQGSGLTGLVEQYRSEVLEPATRQGAAARAAKVER